MRASASSLTKLFSRSSSKEDVSKGGELLQVLFYIVINPIHFSSLNIVYLLLQGP